MNRLIDIQYASLFGSITFKYLHIYLANKHSDSLLPFLSQLFHSFSESSLSKF